MRIDSSHNINNLPNKKNIETTQEGLSQEVKTESAVVYEKSMDGDESLIYDLTKIDQLIKESENVLEQLEEMIEGAVKGQSETLDLIREADQAKANIGRQNTFRPNVVNQDVLEINGVKVDKDTLELAKQSIRPNGSLGEEKVSEEIVDFVKVASDGKKGRLDILLGVIDESFEEVESLLGKLPDLSRRTYDRIGEKLDTFISLENLKMELENPELELEKTIQDIVINQAKTDELLDSSNLDRMGLVEEDIADGLGRKVDRGQELTIKGELGKNSLMEIEEDISSQAKGLLSQRLERNVEEISGKIVEFVKLASAGDREKLEVLKIAIDKGFSQAEKVLGQLPLLSETTYSRIMMELKDWEEELEKHRYPGWPIFAESMNFYRRIKEYSRFGIRTYLSIILTIFLLYYGLRYLIR